MIMLFVKCTAFAKWYRRLQRSISKLFEFVFRLNLCCLENNTGFYNVKYRFEVYRNIICKKDYLYIANVRSDMNLLESAACNRFQTDRGSIHLIR